VIAAIDGWPIVMWNGVDSTGKRTGPEQNANLAIVLFFIITLLIAAFLVINIFVGVFVDNYNTASERVNASLKLRARTKKRKIVTLGQQQQEPNPDEAEQEHAPAHKLQWLMREIVTTTAFDLFIAACIALNVITMAFESYHQSAWQEQFLIISNFFFSYIFGLEAVMKLIAFQPKRYFKDGWNKFDYTIVLISFIGIAVETSGQTVALNPTILRVLRVFRIFRILRAFRIFKAAKGLQAIVDTLGKSLPAVANLFGMLCLLFFIYGILAVELFGSLCRTEDSGADGGHPARCKIIADEDLLDAHASFVNIGMALLTLFRIATGDGWADVMNACKLAAGPRLPGAMDKAKEAIAQEKWLEVWEALPGCQSATEMEELFGVDGCYGQELPCESTCGIEFAAPFFFASFLAIANFVLLNLVIAVLMQQLAASENAVQWTEDMVTPKLPRTTLARIYWRWRANARVYTLRMGLPLPQSNAGPTDYPSARRSGFRGPELLEPLGASGQGLVQRAVDAYAGTANPLTEVGANVTAPDGPTQFVAETQDEAGPLPRVNTATAFNMTAALQETEEDGPPPAPAPQRQGSGHFVVAEEDLNLISRGSDAPSIPRPQPPTQPNPRPQPQPPAAPNTRPQPPAAPNTRPQRLRPGATAPAAPAPQTFVGRSTPPPYELKPVNGEANDQVVDWSGGEAQAKPADTET